MKQIRQGVFETNSSSTHSICVAKDVQPIVPLCLKVGFGEFGWEIAVLRDSSLKAAYLYTGLLATERTRDVERMKQYLHEAGVDATFKEPEYSSFTYKNDKGEDVAVSSLDSGYIDHTEDLGPFLDHVCGSKEALISYLFSPLSHVITGNDNTDDFIDVATNYPNDTFYKGN